MCGQHHGSVEDDTRFPLSSTQHGMLFDRLFGEQPGVHLEQIVCTLPELVESPALQMAWQCVFDRHATFRASFHWDGLDEPEQVVHSRIVASIQEHDCRNLDEPERQATLEQFLRDDRAAGFDLTTPPLVRLNLFRFADDLNSLVWTFYHGLLDGRCFAPVLEEVFDTYQAYAAGSAPESAPSAGEHGVPYRRYIDWLATQSWDNAEQFWREQLKGFTAPTSLLTAFAPGRKATDERSDYAEEELELPSSVTQSLVEFAAANDVTVNTLFQAAWGLLLSRYSGESDVVFGSVRACRKGSVDGAEDIMGVFINTLPMRLNTDTDAEVSSWLREVRQQQVALRPYEHTPLVQVQQWSEVGSGTPLFDTLLIFDHALLGAQLQARGAEWERRDFVLHDQTNYPLTIRGHLYGSEPRLLLNARYYNDRFGAETVRGLLQNLSATLQAFTRGSGQRLSEISVLSPEERNTSVVEWNATETGYPRDRCVHHLIAEQCKKSPNAPALIFRSETLTYRELDDRSTRLAQRLVELGIGKDCLVGLYAERSIEMVVGVLATLKAGGAYVPLDPEYPDDRLQFMVEDSGLKVLLTNTSSDIPFDLPNSVHVERLSASANMEFEAAPAPISGETSDAAPGDLAYVIYTSGSTGKPKGVLVEHRNVVNFFAGMDSRIEHKAGDSWLAVTSLSFDISVLELLWTLARGLKVVLFKDDTREEAERPRGVVGDVGFSLLYFASEAPDNAATNKYNLLLEGAKFADTHGFEAVWTPERHFDAFGGLYPNPSVVGAAIAATTDNVHIRSGSVVLPLQQPLRIAEEWSVVDNISGGRVGVSFASGWQPNDFVLAPDNYSDRKGITMRGIETVRRLWRGESVTLPDGNRNEVEVSILPRPLQRELPVWLTAAGAPDTFRSAGEIGANVLTHLLGQSVEELIQKLAIYRDAWSKAGHPGRGRVTVMLHTFVGKDVDTVRDIVRTPMKNYLQSALNLVKKASWHWPTTAGTEENLDETFNALSADERDALLEHAFLRYFEDSGLFGTPASCLPMIETLTQNGVDEIACLIDFGVEEELVLEHLVHLNELRALSQERSTSEDSSEASAQRFSFADLVEQHDVSHLQCTPSMATMLTTNEESAGALRHVKQLMLGGEALPPALAARLRELTDATITNMYGPTETTIWSATHALSNGNELIPIGKPIANTQIYIVDRELNPLPVGAAGELLIGGDGVVRGYLNRAELTSERFVNDPIGDKGGRLYRTGDLARFRFDGTLEFLGRLDHQVKIRGHRIELGEIEASLNNLESIRDAVVVAREDTPGDKRLVAYLIVEGGSELEAEAVRKELRARLPEYMLPSSFVFLDKFPLTPNAKVDRKALPAPNSVRAPQRSVVPPGNELEKNIAEIWTAVLSIDDVGMEDNFFDIGGHSLHVVQVHSRLRKLVEQDISMTDLFRFPTIRSLAKHLSGEEDNGALQKSADRAQSRKQAMNRRRQRRGQVRTVGDKK